MVAREVKQKHAQRLAPARQWRRSARIALGGVLGVALLAFALRWAGVIGGATLPAPRETIAAAIDRHAEFAGSAACASCHAAQHAAWSRSTHGRAGGPPSRDRVIAAFNGQPLRFRDATVTPRVDGGRYEFVVAQDEEAPVTLVVDGVVGGGHMEGGGTQGFVSRRPDGTVRFLPFDWSRQGRRWFCNTNSRVNHGWVPITPALRLVDCGDWPPVRVLGELPRYANCQSCHASQLTVSLGADGAGWRTQLTSFEINCESCHGPGQRHVQLARGGPLGADVGFEPLAARDKDASIAVCFQCHAVKDRLRDGFVSGDSLAVFYSVRFPTLGDRPLVADGRTRTFAYQEGHLYSDCYLNGGMTCTSCHDPHSQQYRDVTGTPLRGRFDDGQCTACHQSKRADAAAHTHHAAGTAGSRCTSCHMPYLQQPETGTGAVQYRRSDHTIAIPRPAWDSAQGVPNACATCHATWGTAELERRVRAWWGEGKPMKPVITAQARVTAAMPVSEAWPLLLGAAGDTAGDRLVAARFAGAARLLEQYAHLDERLPSGAVSRLRALSAHADLDVRALALATLHLTDAQSWSAQRLMARALRGAGAHDAGLRARWAIALGFMGDRLVTAGTPAQAEIAYRRALEITPRDPRLLLNLANALRDTGDRLAAIAAYRASLALDPAQPITLVNLGIAQEAAGDTTAAVAVWTRAAALDPGEPFAPFNLANAAFAAGRLDEARSRYERATELDASLAAAHFQLARIALLQGDRRRALAALARGLRFDSTNAAALETYERLRAAGGRR